MEKQPFYLIKRKLNSGRNVYYYYFYDQFGNRTTPHSTGCSKKAEAFQYCVNLLKCNNLENNKTKFKTFARGFFENGSIWYKDKALSGEVTQGTIKGYVSYFNYHVMPYFSEMYIDKINPSVIKEFRVYLADEKDLANKTINNIVSVLGIIMGQAIDENIILKNPVESVRKLPKDTEREAFTKEQVLSIINRDWQHNAARLFVITGAITGMRFSEILGLQPECLHDNYINVTQQWYDGKLTDTKTGENRFVTCPEKLITLLRENCQGEFVFTSPEDFTKPYSRSVIIRKFYEAYTKDMLKDKDDKLLTFHSLRHFLNTYLISNHISESKVNFVIGHSSGKGSMMALYTSWKPDMYTDVLELQQKLLNEFNL